MTVATSQSRHSGPTAGGGRRISAQRSTAPHVRQPLESGTVVDTASGYKMSVRPLRGYVGLWRVFVTENPGTRTPAHTARLLCMFFTAVIGLGCSAVALSSYGSGVVSELLEAESVPDTAAIPVRTGARPMETQAARPDSPSRALVYLAGSRPLQHHA